MNNFFSRLKSIFSCKTSTVPICKMSVRNLQTLSISQFFSPNIINKLNNLKIKLLDKNAKVPFRANKTDAGADLYSIEDVKIMPLKRKAISTGISVEIPEGYYGRIAPRSGLAYKSGVDVLAGVVDSDYRGEIKVILFNTDKDKIFQIKIGDKIAQLIIEDHFNFEFEIADELSYTERGEGGFGSTGK